MKGRDTKGTFQERMGMIKDRNGKDLTEAEMINKSWQEYTEELYKTGLNDLDGQDGVLTHLELDILSCEVKWAIGSITTNKANGSDGIPAELLKLLKDNAAKVLHSTHQQIWNSAVARTGEGQFSFQSQRRAEPKNVQTTIQLYSFHMVTRSYSKSFKVGFSSM